MTVIFRAHDGKEFNNAPECAAYEATHPIYKMWDSAGETNHIDSALIVEIDDSTVVFEKDCQDQDITTEGIFGSGLYMWSNDLLQWVLVNDNVQEALRHCFG